jgi:hypothetical protein
MIATKPGSNLLWLDLWIYPEYIEKLENTINLGKYEKKCVGIL